ncbi:hypothetical protein ABFS82_13G070600 [Erythranthe guttata]|uniref:DUF3082 domain-containing protein n=1 Tax=Erythranthe guttata TaxID=4155 RepID=A0A022RY60_ERYGU|nr:PREDICTED: uncharacterized protein LOC105967860 [Erythranthe guttata]EYU44979.1 hypothetical protein MIMGU_mgv1a011905mg [Erythranthe guttata]|eukprot:XP_012847915.1 PREDICTED: uncharacterized protein LOC105967860 [Erythranthe guttata]
MLLTQRQLLPFSSANFLLPSHSPFPFRRSINFPSTPTNWYSRCSAHKPWIAELSQELTTAAITDESPPEEGPVELPSIPPIFATDDDPTPLQTATSVLLTGAVGLFLFRSLRRRAKRAKEMKFRSSGVKKSLTEEAMDSLKSVTLLPDNSKSSTSPFQAFLGAFSAGVIALILYKFTTTVEASLNRQTIPDNYSVRQITITIRTIINGICYLATFVFGINSLGLLLYSGQLAFNSFMEDSSSDSEDSSDPDSSGTTSTSEDQGSSDV